ncbi:MAG: PAS domain-containing protein, partial [Planctomycetota bacterium]
MTINYEEIWQALPNPAMLLDENGRFEEINGAAEDFLAMSAKALRRYVFTELAGPDSRVSDLIGRVAQSGSALGEYTVDFTWPEAPVRVVDMFAVPLEGARILVMIHPRANAERMGRQLSSRGAAR